MADHEHFLRFWTQCQPVVASYVRSMIRDPHDAEDVLQDISVVLFRRFDQYDPSRKFVAWALGVAKLEIMSARREQARACFGRNAVMAEKVTDAYASLAPELEQRSDALRECLEQVQGRSREALDLRYTQSLRPDEVASRLGMSALAVRVLLSRVRSMLQGCINRRLKSTLA